MKGNDIIEREVEDPLFDPSIPESKNNPRMIVVSSTVATDPVRRMWKRGDLDDAQYAACKQFYLLYSSVHASAQAAIDLTKPVVDNQPGNGSYGPNLDAEKKLSEAKAELGSQGYRIIELVAGQAYAVKDAPLIITGEPVSPSDQTFYGRFFRVYAENLARFWGYR